MMMSEAEDYMRNAWPKTKGANACLRALGLARASHDRFGGDWADHWDFAYGLPSSEERAEATERYVRHVLPRAKSSPSKDIWIARQASLRGYGTTQECLQAVRRIMSES